MSIVKLRRTVRKQIRIRLFGRTLEMGSAMSIVFWIIVIIFVVGTYYMYGPGGSPSAGGSGQEAKLAQVMATLDGHRITRGEYLARLSWALHSQGAADIVTQRRVKKGVLENMIRDRLLQDAADAESISVSRAEIEQEKDATVDEMIQIQYADKAQLRKILRQKDMSLEDFKQELRRTRLGDDEAIRTQLLFEKLEESIKSRVTLTDQELKDSYTEIKAAHILIKPERLAEQIKQERAKQEPAAGEPADADQNPQSEKPEDATDAQQPEHTGAEEQGESPQVEEPSEAEVEAAARKKLTELRKRIVEEGVSFAELAKQHSDDGSAPSGGDLGWFRRGDMVEQFEEAAFKLKPGEVSDIVKTRFGFHLIKVEDRRQELPEDFEEKKQQYREQVTQERQQRAWETYQAELRDSASVEFLDPELLAYDLLDKDSVKHGAKAAQLLSDAVAADPTNDVARYELAMLYDQAGETDKAIAGLKEIAEREGGPSYPGLYMQLGELLRKQGKTEEAVAAFQSASEAAQTPDFTNYWLHMRLQSVFEQMKKAELAQKEQDWVDEWNKQRGGMGGGEFTIE